MNAPSSAEDVSVGAFRRIPAVRVRGWHGFNGWLPVIGPMHEDGEVIGFHWQHFHIDWRFAPERAFRRVTWRGPSFAFAYLIQDPDTRGDRVILEGPVLKRMKCKRDLPPYPTPQAHWMAKLRERFACAKLINGVCPHRGMPVSAMRRYGDIVECPAHGLRWNVITGELA